MSGILRIEPITKGHILKQGDETILKYKLVSSEALSLTGKTAQIKLMSYNFADIGYQTTTTVQENNEIWFIIDRVIPARTYYLEVIVDKHIFPSRSDEYKVDIDKSSLGQEANIIEIVGKDVIIAEVKQQVDADLSGIVDKFNTDSTNLMTGLNNTYDDLLENGVLQTNINNKLTELETQYSPKLTEVSAQLAQTLKKTEPITLSNLGGDVIDAINGGGSVVVDLSYKQDTLIAGDNIKLNGNIISADLPNIIKLNNLVTNGDFSNGVENTYVSKDITAVTLTNENNQLKIVGTGNNTGYEFNLGGLVPGKIFVKAKLTSNVSTTAIIRRRGSNLNRFTANLIANEPKFVYGTLNADSINDTFITLFMQSAGTLIVDDVSVIDLDSDFSDSSEYDAETINSLIGDTWDSAYQIDMFENKLKSKQDKLIAGSNVSLEDNVISVDANFDGYATEDDLLNYAQKSELTSAINSVTTISNHANSNSTNALQTANTVDGKVSNLQSQINNIVINGDSSVEASQARVDSLGQTHDSLKDRLDNDFNKIVDRFDGLYLNAKYPPIPFTGLVGDANYYDADNFKYYKDEALTIPATDNTPRLQSLVNYVNGLGGGTIFIPTGKYAFRSSVQWKTKVSLKGASKISTQLFAEGISHSLITGLIGAANGSDYANPNVWFEDCQFTDLMIDNKGLSRTGATVDGKALFILYMRRALFRDLILFNTLGTALGCDFLADTVIENIYTDRAGRSSYPTGYGGNSGIGIGTCALPEEPVIVSNCFTYNSGNYGVFVETQHNPAGYKSQYAKIVNCYSEGNKLGYGNKGSGGAQFIGCTAFKNRKIGFHLTQESSGDILIGCTANENGTHGIMIERAHLGDVMIANCETKRNGRHGIQLGSTIRQQPDIMISNLKSTNNGYAGIYSEGNLERLKIDNAIVANNGQDSTAVAANKRAIRIDGINEGVSLTNITFYDDQEVKTQTTGISVSSGTKKLMLNGNQNMSYDPSVGFMISAPVSEQTIGVNIGY